MDFMERDLQRVLSLSVGKEGYSFSSWSYRFCLQIAGKKVAVINVQEALLNLPVRALALPAAFSFILLQAMILFFNGFLPVLDTLFLSAESAIVRTL